MLLRFGHIMPIQSTFVILLTKTEHWEDEEEEEEEEEKALVTMSATCWSWTEVLNKKKQKSKRRGRGTQFLLLTDSAAIAMFSFFSALVLAEALVTLPLILDLPPLTQLSIKAVTLLKKSGSPGFMLIRSFSFAAITSLLTRILGIYKIHMETGFTHISRSFHSQNLPFGCVSYGYVLLTYRHTGIRACIHINTFMLWMLMG